MNRIKLALLLFPVLSLMGCDAMLFMTYTVENRSRNDVTVYLPVYPVDGVIKYLGESKDTILVLKPREKLTIAMDSKIDFPWAARNIYKRNPGICGIQKIQADTTINMGCSRSEWKYRNGTSNLRIR